MRATGAGVMAQLFDQNRLMPTSLEISAICAECRTWRSPRNHRTGGLITFEGVYQHGSAGSDDARFIRWTLRQFLDLTAVDGLVIDCAGLDYQWGDDLSFNTRRSLDEDPLPTRIAISPDQAADYGYAVPDDWITPSREAALSEMDALLRAMKSRL